MDRMARTLVSDALEILRTPARVRQKDLPLLLALSGGLAILITQDDQVRDWIQSDRYVLLDRNRDILEPLGRVSVNQQICGALYLTGYFTESTRLRRVGALGWESSVFTVIITSSLKHLFGRQRPVADRGSRYFEMFGEGSSFPSSHTAQAFSLASVVADEYGAARTFNGHQIRWLVPWWVSWWLKPSAGYIHPRKRVQILFPHAFESLPVPTASSSHSVTISADREPK